MASDPPPQLSHYVLRSRRKREVRATTLSGKRYTKIELAVLQAENAGVEQQRPSTRAGCELAGRPCPFVSCKHHLAIDVGPGGSLKLNFPDIDVTDMSETCSLDVAERGGIPLELVGEYLNLTRERVRQLEVMALKKMAAAASVLREFREDGGG